jgi:hypothetical protein
MRLCRAITSRRWTKRGPLARSKGATVAHAAPAARPEPSRPTVVGLLPAVNIAFDPLHRLSAHALFSRVPATELPFEFPQTFYLIVSLRGVSDGEHQVGMVPEAGVLEFDAEANRGSVTVEDGLAVFALSMVHCVAHRFGAHYLTLTVDGKPLEPAFVFQVDREEAK